MVLPKSILHNIGVVLVGFSFAYLLSFLDPIFGLSSFASTATIVAGVLLVLLGFALRTWATVYFYRSQMSVIRLEPQGTLVTEGPFAFSRNPLYLGGNVFIFFGAGLVLGSPTMLLATTLHLPLIDLFIRREERQLAERFGDAWQAYRQRVRRWI